ncbi:hypothetical protein HJG60_008674 [Phyllostomus discolor]|uniref:Gag polyprotein n=1 Tax=Phyllostomus discolor TaxID=89673 RepID=A0A834DNN7_9CHIR|nr:hypothetical protein HJG60_008674 [Phyllostomus discolor]
MRAREDEAESENTPAADMGSGLPKEQKVRFPLHQQLLKALECQVEEQDLTHLLQTIKSYCPGFSNIDSLDLETWEKVGQKLKWHQENGTPVGHPDVLTWSLVRAALSPGDTGNSRNQESSVTKEGTCRTSAGVVAKPNNKNPPPALNQDLTFVRQCFQEAAEDGSWETLSEYLVYAKQYMQPVYGPLPFEIYEYFREAIKDNGLRSPYTMGLVSAIAEGFRMAPRDWIALTRTVLKPYQFAVWHSEYTYRCHHQAAENHEIGNPVQLNMLLGTGQYESAEEQAKMNPQAFYQCTQAALRALKVVPEDGAPCAGSFTNVRQGATEDYGHFVDRLMRAMERQIENREAIKALLLPLAYENANSDCKAMLRILRWTATDISQFIKACQDVGTAHYQATLLVAEMKRQVKCFNCGRPGHTRWECQNKQQNNPKHLPSKDCPRCGKGKHWANQCRSKYDKDGKPLPPQGKGAMNPGAPNSHRSFAGNNSPLCGTQEHAESPVSVPPQGEGQTRTWSAPRNSY